MWQKDILRADAILVMPRTCWRIGDEPFLLLHREHGTGYWRSWNCCDRRTCFVVIWKQFCFILSTSTKIQIDSVMRPLSSVGGAIQVPQLQLQLQLLKNCWKLHGLLFYDAPCILATEPFPSSLLAFGTVCSSTWRLKHHCLSSAAAWRHVCPGAAFSWLYTRHSYCCAREVTLSLSDTVIVLVIYLEATCLRANHHTQVNSFSTRLLSSCTDEYAHTYDISTYWVSSDRVS